MAYGAFDVVDALFFVLYSLDLDLLSKNNFSNFTCFNNLIKLHT